METNCSKFWLGLGVGSIIGSAKNKMANTGTKVADKVADEAFNIAEKTDDIKNKVHSYANNIKK